MAIEAKIAADYWHATPRATGLWKQCPRCSRSGAIWVAERPGVQDELFIVWDGPARGPRHEGVGETDDRDIDTGLSFGNLLDPIFGCGYDE